MSGDDARPGDGRRALVVTISDGVTSGTREDASGDGLAARLVELGFDVDRATAPDEGWQIEEVLVDGAAGHGLVLTTGGTGLTPRDVTPQATAAVVDYEVPGMAELCARRAGARRRWRLSRGASSGCAPGP